MRNLVSYMLTGVRIVFLIFGVFEAGKGIYYDWFAERYIDQVNMARSANDAAKLMLYSLLEGSRRDEITFSFLSAAFCLAIAWGCGRLGRWLRR